MVETLLIAGAKANQRCSSTQLGRVQGIQATQIGNDLKVVISVSPATGKIARLLLEGGGNPDGLTTMSTASGEPHFETPLCLASSAANSDAVAALLRAGGDPNLGKSALKCALHLGYFVGRTRLGSRDDWTPLMLAAALDLADTAQLLIQKGADYMATARDGNARVTAMSIARIRGLPAVVARIARVAIPKPGETTSLRSDAASAATEEDLSRVLQKGRSAGIKLVTLRAGVQIQIEETKMWSYRVRFRVVADDRQCWNVIDAVQR
jgi:ankyrin repeat protein